VIVLELYMSFVSMIFRERVRFWVWWNRWKILWLSFKLWSKNHRDL